MKYLFDKTTMFSISWQWRVERWKRNIKGFFHNPPSAGGGGFSVTKTIILINLLLFTLMTLHGTILGLGIKSVLFPPTKLLAFWGAQFWPLVINEGEWWRCITYAFTHGGIIHIGFNMMVLYQVGPLIESEIGKAPYIFLYTLTALTATLLGYFWHPMTPVVGASGSLFGLIGFAVAYYHRMGQPGEHLRNFMFQWAVYAFIFGLLVGADNAGHLGGALGGAAFGFILPIGLRGIKAAAPLFNILSVVSAAAIIGSLGMLVLSWFN